MDRRRFLAVLPLLPVALKALQASPSAPLWGVDVAKGEELRPTTVRSKLPPVKWRMISNPGPIDVSTLVDRQRDFLRWAESRGAHLTPWQKEYVAGLFRSTL